MISSKPKIAIFASGTGSNARAIIEYSENSNFDVALIVSNKEKAGVLQYAEEYDIDALVIDRENFYNSEIIVDFLKGNKIELIILAGFLWLVPHYFIKAFPDRIINIHPSLLPKYGGKGMYGINVHQAVFEVKEKESGLTIHLVNNEYDKGEILLQKTIDISSEKDAESIGEKILQQEHKLFPQTIEKYISKIGF